MSVIARSVARERLLVLLVTLVGVAARFWAFGRLGLTHFDEGIYALAGMWSLSPEGLARLDPGVIPYAPPGFPILVGVAYGVFGVSDGAAIFAAAACGVLVTPLAAWLAGRTFGAGAGVAAAAFAALSVAGIAFSRKALTDIPFLLCWLTALGAAGRYLERPGVARAVALGAAVALAQYFKYNGWLTGAITLVAALAGALRHGEERRRGALARTFGFGVLAAGVAALLYWPWVAFVEQHGGYAALLRHHRSYIGGVSEWRPHWNAQLAEAHALSGAPVFPALGWVVAWTCLWVVRQRGASRQRWLREFLPGLVLGAVCLGELTNLPWWVGLAACGPLLGARAAAPRVLGAWWLVLALVTPFYHPYARLWLPTQAAGWLFLAGMATRLSDGHARPDDLDTWGIADGPRWAIPLGVACVGLAATHAVLTHPAALPAASIFDPDPSLREATYALAPPRPSEPEATRFIVLARRPVAFYLTLTRQHAQLADGVASLLHRPPPNARAIVDEALVVQEGDPTALLARLRAYWSAEERFADRLDPVTLLDVDPAAAQQAHPKRAYSVWRLVPRRDAARSTPQ